MTEITREGHIKLEVMNTDVERKQKSKRQIMSNWPGRRKKEQQQIRLEKKIHDKPINIRKKKRKEEPENVFEKKMEKKKKKKMKDDTNTFFFVFTDFWVLGLLYVLLSCFYILLLQWRYYNFVDQFDMMKSGTLV